MAALRGVFSEYGLIRARVLVEVWWASVLSRPELALGAWLVSLGHQSLEKIFFWGCNIGSRKAVCQAALPVHP